MKKRVVDLLVKTAEEHDMDVSAYREYSGRFMYGASTSGIVVRSLVDLAAVATLAGFEAESASVIEEVFEEIRNARVDNLGKQWIVY